MEVKEMQRSPVFRTVMLFVGLLLAAVVLIMLGRRNDAVTLALSRQSGVLMADEVTVSARNVSGTLMQRPVLESDLVEAGQILMVLDDSDYRIAERQLKAQLDNSLAQIAAYRQNIKIERENLTLTTQSTERSLESSAAQLKSAKAAYDKAAADHQRYSSLLRSKTVSKADYDAVYSDYIAASAAYTSAQKEFATLTIGLSAEESANLAQSGEAGGLKPLTLKVAQQNLDNMQNTLESMEAAARALEAQLAQARLDLERTVVRAPCAGKILNLNYEEGELVSANSPAVVLEKRERYVDFYLPELYAGTYQAGQQVKIRAAVNDQLYDGKVRYINPAPSYAALRMTREQGQADLSSYEMRVYIDTDELLPGLTMELDHD